MKRQVVSKHDSRDLIAEVERSSGIHLEVPRSAQVEILEPDDGSKFVIVDGRFTFVNAGEGGSYIPFVGSAEAVGLLPVADNRRGGSEVHHQGRGRHEARDNKV